MIARASLILGLLALVCCSGDNLLPLEKRLLGDINLRVVVTQKSCLECGEVRVENAVQHERVLIKEKPDFVIQRSDVVGMEEETVEILGRPARATVVELSYGRGRALREFARSVRSGDDGARVLISLSGDHVALADPRELGVTLSLGYQWISKGDLEPSPIDSLESDEVGEILEEYRERVREYEVLSDELQ